MVNCCVVVDEEWSACPSATLTKETKETSAPAGFLAEVFILLTGVLCPEMVPLAEAIVSNLREPPPAMATRPEGVVAPLW